MRGARVTKTAARTALVLMAFGAIAILLTFVINLAGNARDQEETRIQDAVSGFARSCCMGDWCCMSFASGNTPSF